jgi:hypothetical protein
MTIDHASFEERRYTRQHDRVFHAVVQQVQELDARLRYVEQLLEPRAADSTPETRAIVADVRESSSSLAETIATIGDSLEAVVEALDTSSHPAASTSAASARTASQFTTPRDDQSAPATRNDEEVVVELDHDRRSKTAAWRANPNRQPGWMPVNTS